MHQVDELSLKKMSRMKRLGIVSLGLGGILIFYWISLILLKLPSDRVIFGNNIWVHLGCLLLVVVLTVVLHEGMHGLSFWLFGGKVKFGGKWKTPLGPAFYTTMPNQTFPKRKFQIGTLAPQVLTVASIILLCLPLNYIAKWVILWVGALNFGGGCLDMYVVFWLWKQPKGSLVEDTVDGGKVYQE